MIHGRWAMLGAAGCLGVEVLGYGNWYDAPLPLVSGGQATYFGATVPFDLGTLTAVEFALMAGVESMRGGAETEKRVYPGGAFDPMGMVSAGAAVGRPAALPWPACSDGGAAAPATSRCMRACRRCRAACLCISRSCDRFLLSQPVLA